MGEVKLIGSTISLFCTRIEWALKLKGVEYEYIAEDLQNKTSVLRKSNPVHKKVPVLVHNDKPIAESLVILEYIDELWNEKPLLPEDPCDGALARFWAKFCDEKCLMSAFGACSKGGGEKDKAVESAIESFAFLDKQIEGKKYFGVQEIRNLQSWYNFTHNQQEESSIIHTRNKKAQLVFIPTPGIDHLFSAVDLAKLLVHHLSITVLIMKLPSHSKVSAYLDSVSAANRINFVHLANDHIPLPGSNPRKFFPLYIESHKPHVKAAVSKLLHSESASDDSPRLAGFALACFVQS
ncbi:glutathione S-transferase omega-1-like [Pistacia vera]|uniref:glutathione S-transferase omega-1-like n=1 Tax=Pistacia vera TaxID=55513 RepID=UPI001262DB61|nr:glutathione S-transferase omega-1-like [Pistacia vera]